MFGHRDRKLIDQFICADDIDPQFFEENHSRYFGKQVEWKMCTHMSNGKEGYLCKVSEQIPSDIIEQMARDARAARQRLRDEANRRYFEKLHAVRRQQRQEHRQSQLEEQYRREQERADLNLPTFQLPPTYRNSQIDYNLSWDDQEQSWAQPQSRLSNDSRFTRSTPTTPISPQRDSYWHDPLEIRRPYSPVSPLSYHGDYSSLIDQYQQRPLSAGFDQGERPRRRPRSAINLGQPPTGQAFLNIFHNPYA